MNFNPLTWRTRLSYRVRDVLFACGVKQWRGWPTSPGFRRIGFRRDWIEQQLATCGLNVERVWDEEPNQTFVPPRAVSSSAQNFSSPIERKGDHIANVRGSQQPHDQAIETQRHSRTLRQTRIHRRE